MGTESAKSNKGGGLGRCLTSYVDFGSVESHRLYLSRRTIMEMLKDRGCLVPDSELTRSLDEFRSDFGQKPDLEHLRICLPLSSNPSKKILVIFCEPEEIRVAAIRAIFGKIMNKENLHRLMLVLQSKMNAFARKEVEKFPIKVDIFHITDLLANITKHILMPKHEILSAAEKQKLLNKYKLEEKQLPRMLESDAIARYYGLEKGQVVKVTYNGGEITDSLLPIAALCDVMHTFTRKLPAIL